ncbi:MMPL family transporter, partial [Microbacterium sp.]|uniref:MMPL family transporter n=1 Tax=Microbacterium sp. TaxID=51671 RepID=UPI003C739F96
MSLRSESTHRSWPRVLLSSALILMWLVGAGLGGPLFGRVDEVSSNDATAYLPDSAPATEVQRSLGDFLGSDSIPAVVVFSSETKIDDAVKGELTTALDAATDAEGVKDGSSPVLLSEDGLAAQAFVPIDADADVGEVSAALSSDLKKSVPDGVAVHITGPAGFTADLLAGFSGIDGILLLVALLAVLVILVIVYRSLLLPVIVLCTSLFALCVALLVVWWAAKLDILLLSGQTQGILFILVIGAATDYSLLLVSRFREELHATSDRWAAVRGAWKGAFEPILASGGTVIAGLLCLLLSDLKSNSTLGPVAAIGIVFAMLAALTLLPALLGLFGRAAFWPRRPKLEPESATPGDPLQGRGPWQRLARGIRRHPRAIWIPTALVLAVAAVGGLQLNASGVPQSDLVLGSSEARDGQAVLGQHFPGGSGSPVYVLVEQSRLQDAADVLLADKGIDGVSVTASDSPSGSAPVTENGITALGRPGTPAPDPTVEDGRVLLQGTLTDAADSPAAERTVQRLRADLTGTDALVGGVTATAVDTNAASIHDRNLIIPVVL